MVSERRKKKKDNKFVAYFPAIICLYLSSGVDSSDTGIGKGRISRMSFVLHKKPELEGKNMMAF